VFDILTLTLRHSGIDMAASEGPIWSLLAGLPISLGYCHVFIAGDAGGGWFSI